MKKTTYASILIMFAFLIVPVLSHAQTGAASMKNNYTGTKIDPPGIKPQNAKEIMMMDDRMRLPADVERRKAMGFELSTDGKIITRGQENRIEILRKHAGTIIDRLNAAVTRLEGIIMRIESRNKKIQSEGGDVSASEKSVAAAKEELAKAKTDIASLPKILLEIKEEASTANETVSANTSNTSVRLQANKDVLMKVRTTIQSAKGHLEAARKHLVDTMTAIKGIRASSSTEASVNATI